MSNRSNQTINPFFISQKDYNLAIKHSQNQTNIKMSLLTSFYHTFNLPNTYGVLNQYLPSVLQTKCFNDSNLPFDIEVKNTEIGHLFEHILLEYLCQLKIESGHQKASFRGVTNWDWKKDKRGTFHIAIDLTPMDIIFLDIAIEKSTQLLNKILSERNLGIN